MDNTKLKEQIYGIIKDACDGRQIAAAPTAHHADPKRFETIEDRKILLGYADEIFDAFYKGMEEFTGDDLAYLAILGEDKLPTDKYLVGQFLDIVKFAHHHEINAVWTEEDEKEFQKAEEEMFELLEKGENGDDKLTKNGDDA